VVAVVLGFAWPRGATFLDSGVNSAVAMGLAWLYFALFESSPLRASPGKLAFGARVVDCAGNRIGFLRASARLWALYLLVAAYAAVVRILHPGLFFAFPFLALLILWAVMPAFTNRKQSLHDWIAKTLVVLEPGLQAFREGDTRGLQDSRPKIPRWAAAGLVVAIYVGLPVATVGSTFAKYAHGYQFREQVTEAARAADNITTGVAEYAASWGKPAPDNATLGLPAPEDMKGRYVSAVTVVQGKVIVTLGNEAASELQGKHLEYLVRGVTELPHCSSPDIPVKWLPVRCR
jgi:uncharacterized RDD family membrane protein YckC